MVGGRILPTTNWLSLQSNYKLINSLDIIILVNHFLLSPWLHHKVCKIQLIYYVFQQLDFEAKTKIAYLLFKGFSKS